MVQTTTTSTFDNLNPSMYEKNDLDLTTLDHIFLADFETTPEAQFKLENKTRVYSWGLMNMVDKNDYFSHNDPEINALKAFFNHLEQLNRKMLIYFHNFSGYDSEFLKHYLFKYANYCDGKVKNNNDFSILEDSEHSVLNIVYRINDNNITFQCSYKLIPRSIAALNGGEKNLKIDYDRIIKTKADLDPNHDQYLYDDLLIQRNAVFQYYKDLNGHVKLTLASSALNFQKQIEPNDDILTRNKIRGIGCCVDTEFKNYTKNYEYVKTEQEKPNLTKKHHKYIKSKKQKPKLCKKCKFNEGYIWTPIQEWNYLSNFYRGGNVQLNPTYRNVLLFKVYYYDIISSYPFASTNNYLPILRPIYDCTIDKCEHRCRLYEIIVMEKTKLKPNMHPFIPKSRVSKYISTQYYRDIEQYTTLYMTNIDLDDMIKYYEPFQYHVVKKTCFRSSNTLHLRYYNYWFNKKNNSTGVEQEIAKLHCNSLYGKRGQNPVKYVTKFFIAETINGVKYYRNNENQLKKIRTNQILYGGKYYAKVVRDEKPIRSHSISYIPLAIFITSYARNKLLTQIQKHWDTAVYWDTDSLILTKPSTSMELGNNLGAWKQEWCCLHFKKKNHQIHLTPQTVIDEAKFLRAKTYYLLINGKSPLIKMAGLVIDGKEYLEKHIDQFNFGSKIKDGRKAKVKVNGGYIIIKRDFEIS